MADYTQWDINDYLPGQPLTSAKAISYHENLDATCEGAAGAPRVTGKALGDIRQGMQTATGTNWITLTGLADYKTVRLVCVNEQPSEESRNIEIALSTDNGATWVEEEYIGIAGTGASETFAGFEVLITLDTGVVFTFYSSNMSTGVGRPFWNFTDRTYNAIRIRQETSGAGNTLRVLPLYFENRDG